MPLVLVQVELDIMDIISSSMKKIFFRRVKYLAILIGVTILVLVVKVFAIYKNDQYIKWIPPFGFYVGDVHYRGPSADAIIERPEAWIHPDNPTTQQ